MRKGVSGIASVSLLLALVMAFAHFPVFGATDEYIFTDPIANIYIGRREAENMIKNLDFTDLPGNHWAKDAVVRSGALDMVKGFDSKYSPASNVSNEEALAFILRALGREADAQAAGVAARNLFPEDSPLRTIWSLGYLTLANQMGLLTREQYNDSMIADTTDMDPLTSFVRTAPVTRERAAYWLVNGINSVYPGAFPERLQQGIYTGSDWESVSAEMVKAVETVITNGIMTVTDGTFRPKSNLNRAEMAQVLKNMDGIYYDSAGVQKKTGTVGGFKDAQSTQTGSGHLSRQVYVRNENGKIDVLEYDVRRDTSPQSGSRDCVVLKEGKVAGLASLSEGDKIEYLVRPSDMSVLYVQVLSTELEIKTLQGILSSVDTLSGAITISSDGKTYTYTMADRIYGNDGAAGFVFMDEQRRDAGKLPFGSAIELRLKNNVVDWITYLGEPVLVHEIRGIVKENNPELGFITVIDPRGGELTKYFYEDELKVKKKQYYDMSDEVGYISEVFPNFRYNPLESDIYQIEAGDVVFIRMDPDDPEVIESISAATNYTTRYGKIREFRTEEDISSMMIEFEDKQTAWFDFADSIFIGKAGRPITVADIQPGDWAKLLINQALIEPGYVMESVKELTIEASGHEINTIIKGQLAGINSVQNELVIQNAQTLTKQGWTDHHQIRKFSITAKDIEYYQEGKRISLDYAVRNLKRADGEVYIALEDNYAGERVRKVTFRYNRDELLDPDFVITSDNLGSFFIITNDGNISTDDGTIVVRNGRLVDGRQIMNMDFVQTSLTGQNSPLTAAVVNIVPAPDFTGIVISVVRGRVLSVDEGKSFKVQSMATLAGIGWNFTPVQREFAMDYNTIFINESGVSQSGSFIGYTEESVIDKVYTIVMEGSRASRIVDAPYTTKAVRGTIYQISDGVIGIKNATYYDADTGKWPTISLVNATVTVSVPVNSIIIKNNEVVSANKLAAGDQIRIMTNDLPDPAGPGMSVTGYIIMVEK